MTAYNDDGFPTGSFCIGKDVVAEYNRDDAFGECLSRNQRLCEIAELQLACLQADNFQLDKLIGSVSPYIEWSSYTTFSSSAGGMVGWTINGSCVATATEERETTAQTRCCVDPIMTVGRPGDNCGYPVDLNVHGNDNGTTVTYTGTTTDLANDYATPNCTGSAGPDFVGTWVSNGTGEVIASTALDPGRFDTVLFVREASCSVDAEIACNDDRSGGDTYSRSELTFDAVETRTYYIFVDGCSTGNFGPFGLTLTRRW